MTITLTARGPEDLLAAVPVVLGFRPEHSLVMLTFDAGQTFHARVDLPDAAEADDDAVLELAEVLLEPCRTHAVGRVALVVYGDDPAVASAIDRGITPVFEGAGVEVLAVLRAHDGWWWRVRPGPGVVEEGPHPYDETVHPFAARAVFAGRVTHPSREALRATLAAEPEACRRVGDRLLALGEPGPGDGRRALDLVARCVAERSDPDDAAAARVLQVLSRAVDRDAMLDAVTRETAIEHLRVWTGLLRCAPDEQVPDAAAVTAFCAWQAGDGALAWCALDRCFAVDPDHRLAGCLAECLTRAVPPTAWHEPGDAEPGRRTGR